MSKRFQLSKDDLIRGLQYSWVIFVGAFLFELSTRQEVSTEVLLEVLNTTVIAWSWIIVNKFFSDYSKFEK